MAIGTTAAILGSAAIGAGASIASSRAQSSAARNAAQTAQNATDANNATALQIFNQQTALNEPFRQYEIQQRNALGEVLGFDPVGQSAGAGMPAGGQVGSGSGGYGTGGVGASGTQPYSPSLTIPQGIAGQAGGAPNDGNSAAMNALSLRGPMNAIDGGGRQLVGGLPPAVQAARAQSMSAGSGPGVQVQDTQGVTNPVASTGDATTTGATQGLFDSSIGGADRFNNSLFNPLAQTMFNTDRDRIDANLANSGLLYDGVRQTAVQEAGNRSAQNALSMYLNTIMGSPSTQATNNLTTAAGNYGSNVMNNTTSGANALMAAQQAQGQSQADMWGNLATAGGSALGAFNWGGKSGFGF
jgi:hypothetical protein